MGTRQSIGFVLMVVGVVVGLNHAFHTAHALGTPAVVLLGAATSIIVSRPQGKS